MASNDDFDEKALIKQIYADQETYKKEEQRRFEILDAHWDLPIKDLDLNAQVSCMDSMFLLRRSLSSLLTAAASKQTAHAGKGVCELGSLSDLSSNAILDRGSIVGLWEYDPEPGSIAWLSFGKVDKPMRECVSQTEAYIRDQLGDARSFSLDSPKSRVPRIKAIRDARKKTK